MIEVENSSVVTTFKSGQTMGAWAKASHHVDGLTSRGEVQSVKVSFTLTTPAAISQWQNLLMEAEAPLWEEGETNKLFEWILSEAHNYLT